MIGAIDPRHRRAILALTWLAAFTPILDLDIVTVALPLIGRAYSVGASELGWVVNAYILVFAVSILAVGRLGDTLGRRRVLLGGAVLFTIGSAGAALAPDLPALLAMRTVQGLGGSALLTTSLAIVSAGFSGAERTRAIGVYFSGGAFGGVVGPVAGGLLTSLAGWRAMFAVQVPLSLALLVLIVLVLRDERGTRRSLDLPGLALGTIALGGVNTALLQARDWGWLSAPSLGAWTVAAIGLVGFVIRERSAADPAVRLAVFRNRRFVASSLAGAAMWFSILAVSVQLPIYLQAGRGLSPAQTGLLMLTTSLSAFLAFPRVGRLAERVGGTRLMIGGLALTAPAIAVLAALDASGPLSVVVLVGALMGGTMAATIATSAAGAVTEFPPAEAGTASGVFNSIRQVGSSLGVALPAALFDLVSRGSLAPASAIEGTRVSLLGAAIVVAGLAAVVARLSFGVREATSGQPARGPAAATSAETPSA